MRLDGRQHLPQIDFFSGADSVYLSMRGRGLDRAVDQAYVHWLSIIIHVCKLM